MKKIDFDFENENPFYKKPDDVNWDEFEKVFAEKTKKYCADRIPETWLIRCPECRCQFRYRKEKRCPECGVTLYLFNAGKEAYKEITGWVRKNGRFYRVEEFLSSRKEKDLTKKDLKNLTKNLRGIMVGTVKKTMRNKNVVEISTAGSFYNQARGFSKIFEEMISHELKSGKVTSFSEMSEEEKVSLKEKYEKNKMVPIETKIAFVSQHCSGSLRSPHKKRRKRLVEGLARYFHYHKRLSQKQLNLLDEIFTATKNEKDESFKA